MKGKAVLIVLGVLVALGACGFLGVRLYRHFITDRITDLGGMENPNPPNLESPEPAEPVEPEASPAASGSYTPGEVSGDPNPALSGYWIQEDSQYSGYLLTFDGNRLTIKSGGTTVTDTTYTCDGTRLTLESGDLISQGTNGPYAYGSLTDFQVKDGVITCQEYISFTDAEEAVSFIPTDTPYGWTIVDDAYLDLLQGKWTCPDWAYTTFVFRNNTMTIQGDTTHTQTIHVGQQESGEVYILQAETWSTTFSDFYELRLVDGKIETFLPGLDDAPSVYLTFEK